MGEPSYSLAGSLAKAATICQVHDMGKKTRDQLIMTEEDNVGDPRPAERDFLLEQETFEQGIARYLKS